jgi:hypothetical protein
MNEQQPKEYDGNMIFAKLKQIDEEAGDLIEVDRFLHLLIKGIEDGAYSRSLTIPAEPTTDDIDEIRDICKEQIERIHTNNIDGWDEVAEAWQYVLDVVLPEHDAALIAKAQQEERERIRKIDYLRSLGWMVAVHNDYKQNGEFHTFWLLTYPDGRYLKGEGKTDDEALNQIAESLRQSPEQQEQ